MRRVPAPLPSPFDTLRLPVGDGHRLHVEQYGRPQGLPAIVLHGGPGSGSSARMTLPFDLRRWRVVLVDQRGAGRSLPRGALDHNTTGHLLADIECVRARLGIDRWLVSGGSWGATLAALYAARHPRAVTALLLRGLFLARRCDLDWFFRGAAALRPDAWAEFARAVPAAGRAPDAALAMRARERRGWTRIALAWQRWEAALAGAVAAPPADAAQRAALAAKYRLQASYIARGFDLRPDAVLRALARLPAVPVLLLHGRDDLVCRPEGACLARRAHARSRLHWIDAVGHDPYAPAMLAASRAALRRFAAHGDFDGIGA